MKIKLVYQTEDKTHKSSLDKGIKVQKEQYFTRLSS